MIFGLMCSLILKTTFNKDFCYSWVLKLDARTCAIILNAPHWYLNSGQGGDLLLASRFVLYQLKVPEPYCLICTSCHNPPLQEWHTDNKWKSERSRLLNSDDDMVRNRKDECDCKHTDRQMVMFTWSGARHRDHRAPSWASTVSSRLPEANSKICSFPLWQIKQTQHINNRRLFLECL